MADKDEILARALPFVARMASYDLASCYYAEDGDWKYGAHPCVGCSAHSLACACDWEHDPETHTHGGHEPDCLVVEAKAVMALTESS